MKYLDLAKKLAAAIKSSLISDLKTHGLTSLNSEDLKDIKGTHHVDKVAKEAVEEVLTDVNCNIFLESFTPKKRKNADFSIFIDPVDGSINWDKGVGDPCVAIAIAEKTSEIRFADLSFAYVEGLRSRDYYFSQEGKSFYYSSLAQKKVVINPQSEKKALRESSGYLKCGYNGAEKQFLAAFPLFIKCRDIRSFDNSGTELCELARKATDFILEGRKLSDFYNLLAYPIVKNAGGIICDLEGTDLHHQMIQTDEIYDFIACTNKELLNEILDVLSDFKKSNEFGGKSSLFVRK
ncbi:inositol monophosphatase family protein [Xanthovirga aplysinae]|uniref:inositol monophosphatase family protein n=1 Tax=Xanthovirga aplysinae TaxID=2529853 RepID=UPI0012BBFC9E|nr:inositol monophosphatase family protein [Xanthovirga aplysinae]MTI31578.1 hypothetical protein [Xanthovirga aplysinae]